MAHADKSLANCPILTVVQCWAGHNGSPNSAAGCWTKAWKIRRWQSVGACFFPAGLPSAPTGEQSWQAGCRQTLSPLRQCRKLPSICEVATVAADRHEINLKQIHLTQT